MRVQVFPGDIAKVEADALITAINSGGMWMGGIDGVIQRNAGGMFHEQAAARLPRLKDGQTIVARANGHHRGAFRDVVFVVDDLKRPLYDVVLSGLMAADDAGFMSVSLPTIRMGVMLGVVERSSKEAVDKLAEGIRAFIHARPQTKIKSLTLVVYNDPETVRLAQVALLPLSSIE